MNKYVKYGLIAVLVLGAMWAAAFFIKSNSKSSITYDTKKPFTSSIEKKTVAVNSALDKSPCFALLKPPQFYCPTDHNLFWIKIFSFWHIAIELAHQSHFNPWDFNMWENFLLLGVKIATPIDHRNS